MIVSMEQGNILTLDSINRIRFYVKTKYSHLPKEEHATIVADAIVKIIDRQLPQFTPEVKKEITNKLIEQIIIPLKRPVSIEDISLVCDAVPLESEDKTLLQAWKLEHGVEITKRSLGQMLQEQWYRLSQYIQDRRKRVYYGVAYMTLIIAMLLILPFIQNIRNASAHTEDAGLHESMDVPAAVVPLLENELPAMYQYSEVNKQLLQQYLHSRNSMLTDEPYFSAIMETAHAFNIHPALLFAITGQEQGFVNRDNELASKIINNPFNVFYSWERYNTTIKDSSEIAARTLVNLSKERPAEVDAITWINRKYAEDPKWSAGVRSLFQTIVNYINDK